MLHKIRIDLGFGLHDLLVDDAEFSHLVSVAMQDASNDNAALKESAPAFVPRRWPGLGYPRGFGDYDDEG
jgi:hypothetical protein